jgi:hypothetical protein
MNKFYLPKNGAKERFFFHFNEFCAVKNPFLRAMRYFAIPTLHLQQTTEFHLFKTA